MSKAAERQISVKLPEADKLAFDYYTHLEASNKTQVMGNWIRGYNRKAEAAALRRGDQVYAPELRPPLEPLEADRSFESATDALKRSVVDKL